MKKFGILAIGLIITSTFAIDNIDYCKKYKNAIKKAVGKKREVKILEEGCKHSNAKCCRALAIRYLWSCGDSCAGVKKNIGKGLYLFRKGCDLDKAKKCNENLNFIYKKFRILDPKLLDKLIKEEIPDYCAVIGKKFYSREINSFGREVFKEKEAWVKVLFSRVLKKKSIENRRKELMKLLSFIAYKRSSIYSNIKEYIEEQNANSYTSSFKNFGKVLYITGLRSYLKSTIGNGTLPVYDINVANYSSKKLKIVGRIDYVKLGILLARQLILNAVDEEDFVDRFLLLNSYILTNSLNSSTIEDFIESLFIREVFDSNIKKAFGKFYDKKTPADLMISSYLSILIENANNAKINALIFHLIKGDAIDFMLKDKKVYENYKFMKKIYLQYKKAHKC